MTTRRDFAAPVLDRLIQREVTTSVEVSASTAYAYDTQELQSGDSISDGNWRRDSDTVLSLGLVDSDGVSFPFDLATPLAGVAIAWGGAAPTILTVTDIELLTNPFAQPLGIRLTFGAALPAAAGALTIMAPSGGTHTVTQTTQRPVWAARRDFLGRDLVTGYEGGLLAIADSRFIVRAEGPAWDEGDTFTDDEGVTRTVRGVAQIGRSRFLELLARSVG